MSLTLFLHQADSRQIDSMIKNQFFVLIIKFFLKLCAAKKYSMLKSDYT
jgi:hypothetical protein